MGNKPTITAENVWQSAGADFLQLVNASGRTIESWIDSNGVAHGGLLSGDPVTKTLYVDVNRTDQYTPDGSFGKPFTSIMDAVNQVVVNGDNSASVAYLIDIAPGVYQELIVLENLKLFNLIFEGHNAAFITGGAAGAVGLRSQANNSNLNTVIFNRVCFNAGSNNAFTITMSPSVSSNWEFLNCERIFLGSCTWTGNANFQMNFYYCHLSFTSLTLSSMTSVVAFFQCFLAGGAAYSLTNGSTMAYLGGTRDEGPFSFSMDATSIFAMLGGVRINAGGLNASDNFNRPNGGLGSNWTTIPGTTAPTITSNQVQGTVLGQQAASWTANNFSSDQFAQVTCPVGGSGGNGFIGPACRCSTTAQTFYYFIFDSGIYYISKQVAGVITNLVSTNGTLANGDVLRLDCVGNTLTGKQNGAIILSTTDSSIVSGNPGFNIAGNDSHSVISAWSGGNIPFQINGSFSNRLSILESAITVNSGGTYTEAGGVHSGILTINSGGTYNVSANGGFGIISLGATALGAAAPIGPGQVALGDDTAATTATAGPYTLPSNPAGFWSINIAGATKKIPYYNS